MAQPWPTDCPLWLSEPCLLLTLAGTCCKPLITHQFSEPHMSTAGKRIIPLAQVVKRDAWDYIYPYNFCSRSAWKAVHRKKVLFSADSHVNTPPVLVTWEQKKQADDWLWFMLCTKTNVKPHSPTELRQFLMKCLLLSPSSWIWGQLRRDKLPWGNSDPGNHCLDSPWKNLHIPSSLVWSVLLSTTLCFCLIYLPRKTKWEK